MATKLLGKLIDLPLDKRRQSAKVFFALYQSTAELSGLLQRVILIFENASETKKSIVLSKELVPLLEKTITQSRQFSDAMSKTTLVLDIVDPRLASLLVVSRNAKEVMLSSLGKALESSHIELQFSGLHPFTQFCFTISSTDLSQLNLNAAYEELDSATRSVDQSRAQQARQRLDRDLKSLLQEDRIGPRDFDRIGSLADQLKAQRVVLEEGRTALQALMSQQFTIDDLLAYQPS
jgi:hypothetical protein